MSKVKSLVEGFVGVDGVPTLLAVGAEFEADHPLVVARPELFEEVPEPVAKRPILSRKSKAEDG